MEAKGQYHSWDEWFGQVRRRRSCQLESDAWIDAKRVGGLGAPSHSILA